MGRNLSSESADFLFDICQFLLVLLFDSCDAFNGLAINLLESFDLFLNESFGLFVGASVDETKDLMTTKLADFEAFFWCPQKECLRLQILHQVNQTFCSDEPKGDQVTSPSLRALKLHLGCLLGRKMQGVYAL